MDALTVDTLAEALQEPKRTLLLKGLRTVGSRVGCTEPDREERPDIYRAAA
jgi:hypothetical protein